MKRPANFRYESDLVARGRELLPAFLSSRSRHWRMTVELPVGQAIADIVVALMKRSPQQPVPVLSARESVVLATLRHEGTIRIDRLEQSCGLKRGALRGASLDRLVDAGLVARRCGGHVEVASHWASDTNVVAIEAKLVRWQQALRQAVSYAKYADLVYVMLPGGQAGEARQAEECAAHGVGVLVVGDAGLSERVPPSERSGQGWRREYALSRVLATT